jgi:hypothetical protein
LFACDAATFRTAAELCEVTHGANEPGAQGTRLLLTACSGEQGILSDVLPGVYVSRELDSQTPHPARLGCYPAEIIGLALGGHD